MMAALHADMAGCAACVVDTTTYISSASPLSSRRLMIAVVLPLDGFLSLDGPARVRQEGGRHPSRRPHQTSDRHQARLPALRLPDASEPRTPDIRQCGDKSLYADAKRNIR
jgi:hypothetical protein